MIADLMDYSWRGTGTNILCPQILISFRLVESKPQGTTLNDCRETQGRHVLFPDIVSALTNAEKKDLMEAIVAALIAIKQKRLGE